jgi:hypothetical protein
MNNYDDQIWSQEKTEEEIHLEIINHVNDLSQREHVNDLSQREHVNDLSQREHVNDLSQREHVNDLSHIINIDQSQPTRYNRYNRYEKICITICSLAIIAGIVTIFLKLGFRIESK